MKNLTQGQALGMLCANTHILWSPEGATEILKPFGIKAETSIYEADGNKNPKGLTLKNGATEARGAPSSDLSYQLKCHFNIESRGCNGRGFQVRTDCEAVAKHLKINIEYPEE